MNPKKQDDILFLIAWCMCLAALLYIICFAMFP